MADSTALVVQQQPTFSDEQRKMIRDSLANGAPEGEFAILMEVAKARNLNPITRQIHFVKRWDSAKNREVWSYQVSIDGLRAIAERTGRYDGQDEPEFEYDGKALKLCKVRVYKKGVPRPFVGVAYWSEYVQTKKGGEVTHMWASKPHIMLSKCAEALALRKAFPEDTSGLYTDEEIPQEREINPRPPPVRGVVRDDESAEAVDAHNPETGEVLEQPAADPAQRLNDELLATTLVAACGKGFRAEEHRKRWLAKHKAEIEELKARAPDLYTKVRAAYEAATIAAEAPQEEAAQGG